MQDRLCLCFKICVCVVFPPSLLALMWPSWLTENEKLQFSFFPLPFKLHIPCRSFLWICLFLLLFGVVHVLIHVNIRLHLLDMGDVICKLVMWTLEHWHWGIPAIFVWRCMVTLWNLAITVVTLWNHAITNQQRPSKWPLLNRTCTERKINAWNMCAMVTFESLCMNLKPNFITKEFVLSRIWG